MSLMTDAGLLLGSIQAGVTALSNMVTIGTQTVQADYIETNPFNDIIVEGGVSQSGQQTIGVNKSLLTSFAKYPNGEPPINITPTVIRGISAFVLSVNESDGVLRITTGQPAGNDQ